MIDTIVSCSNPSCRFTWDYRAVTVSFCPECHTSLRASDFDWAWRQVCVDFQRSPYSSVDIATKQIPPETWLNDLRKSR